MSVDIDWSSLNSILAEDLKTRLNDLIVSLPRPDFIGPITIQTFSFGDVPPELEIIDIRDISHGFRVGDQSCFLNSQPREALKANRSSIFKTNKSNVEEISELDEKNKFDQSFQQESAGKSPRSEEYEDNKNPSPARTYSSTLTHIRPSNQSHLPSLQIHLGLAYSGNIRIEFNTALVLNYPSKDFMRLPLRATIVGINLECEIILAIEADQSRFHLSLLELTYESKDEDQEGEGEGENDVKDNKVFEVEGKELYNQNKRADQNNQNQILKDMLIETELGNLDQHLLRNVHKVEKFLIESFRRLINEELVYPTFQTFEWG
ncbi:hypothetical protein BY996DRAFT_6881483 [Phakopsora pachyrhizi]|uniref:Mitochondrial distribution and morphology protein 12 n=1 Tax=Phakopsora pachyrhizi TaxID=170000 RepID=A0AAV0BLT5_PHAPC|nr:hypothetical protein BY996DRAFT_6881483 [Phakopsora pachyrhizi]CAH7686530.1 expressed protein [Phakopsora pachyrhizi]